MTASPGWVSELGIDYTKISYDFFSREDYQNLLMIYLNLGSPYIFEDVDSIKQVINYEPSKKNLDLYEKIEAGNKSLLFLSKESYGLFDLSFTREGARARSKILDRTEQIVSFRNYGKDAYQIKEFSDKFKVVYNEFSFGLFHRYNGELTSINHSTLNQITKFLAY